MSRHLWTTQLLEAASIPEPNSGCWLWLGSLVGKGYASLTHDGKKWKGHRISYLLHKGPIPPELIVRHKCDQPSCINPDHLELGTYVDNAADMRKRGRINRRGHAIGEQAGGARLSNADAVYIATNLGHLSTAEVARRYGVSDHAIRHLRAGRHWGRVLRAAGVEMAK